MKPLLSTVFSRKNIKKHVSRSRRVLIINPPADVIIAIYLSEHLHLHILRVLRKLNSHFS